MSIKILLVENDPQLLELTEGVAAKLEWCELHTLTASHEALNRLESEKFDGAILRADMPELDGFELTRRTRASQLNRAIPIVMLTESDDIESMRKGFKAGVTFFMARPSSWERVYRFFNAVRGAMVLEKRRHHRLPYRTAVDCRWKERGEGHFRAESIDISEGGMSVAPSGGLKEGQELELEFELPQVGAPRKAPAPARRKSMFPESESAPVGPQKLRARVCYITPQDTLGLEFMALPNMHRLTIQTYVSGGMLE